MRLVSFSVKNYRSIRDAQDLSLGKMTVLVGPNNEGKSNIVRAMIVGIRFLAGGRFQRLPRTHSLRVPMREDLYEYSRDCPLDLQASGGATELRFGFDLSWKEQVEFRRLTGVRLTTTLYTNLRFTRDDVVFRVIKQRSGPQLTQKQKEVSDFIAQRLRVVHISAVRTANDAQEVVREMILQELQRLHETPEYRKVLQDLRDLEAPVLQQLADRVRENLSDFIPEIRNVAIQSFDALYPRSQASRYYEMVIDDGVATPLVQKGDGVQSLAALALLKASAETGTGDLILAIEEPEAHLHPKAIRRLRSTLESISERFQVILTTHNPILVSRNPRQNIVVEGNRAHPAQGLDAIREALGVHASDNLSSAELVLLVEGNSDAVIMNAVLNEYSQVIRRAKKDGRFAVQSMDGVRNLRHFLSRVDLWISARQVFLDNDEPARQQARHALTHNLLDDYELHYATVPSMKESELEDLLKIEVYRPVLEKFQIEPKQFRGFGRKKWSEALVETFRIAGRPHDPWVVARVKSQVAEAVAANPTNAFKEALSEPINNLVRALEAKLK